MITLLPDHVANQIAAGEVIQRPASIVKELMENSIDSGATKVQLIIKDAGRTLVQVIDDGCGMTEQDARMSFERHATSKINIAEDLFTLSTKGFRGEALASICAIAHVEMKTRRGIDELGFHLVNEGSVITTQEPTATPEGTSIAVKNISSAAKTYKDIFGAQVSEPLDQPIHGVTVVFVTLPNTKIELIALKVEVED